MKKIDTVYINGEFVTPQGSEVLELINPADEQPAATVRLGNADDIDRAVKVAAKAFETYSQTSKQERIDILKRIGAELERRREELIEAQIVEYGAPRSVAAMLMDIVSLDCVSMVKVLEAFSFTEQIGKARVLLEPIGVAAAIAPWNANYVNIVGKILPALAAGCTMVVKPSELSAVQTQLMAECLDAAGIPKGVVNIINGTGEVAGNALISHKDISKIAFTGSAAVGKHILRTAADTIKRVTLELGGKSPNILLDDADFSKALPLALAACFMNSGQACVAGTRLLVPEHRLDEVKSILSEAVKRYVCGNPWREGVLIGPMVTRKQYERVQRYIRVGLDEGAELIAGGPGLPDGETCGFYVKPTIFAGVTPGMTIAREEIFGPVLSILTYKDEEDAIRIANDTDYGLQAYVSSQNPESATRVASRLKAGTVTINGFHFEPLAPFGGYKQSGLGREFGEYGLRGYLEVKTVIGYDQKL